jgi:hypothetical protein
MMLKRRADNENPWYRRKSIIAAGIALVLFAWLQLQVPSNVGPWHEAQGRTAWVEFSNKAFTVHNVRDFRYAEGRGAVSLDYVDQDYHLDNLQQAWFGLSHFGPMGLAHSFLSFEFSDGDASRYLALSIEGRLRLDQRYKPLNGMFRRYTKIAIFATEQDVIGLRSHVRGERVLLYPVRAPRDQVEAFFLALVEDANELLEAPAFYNTVLENCLTNLLKHTDIRNKITFADFKVLLPGHTDRLTYALDVTPADLPFEEARLRATINPSLSEIDDPGFSASLRCGWNDCQ